MHVYSQCTVRTSVLYRAWYLYDHFKHEYEGKFNETNLGGGFGHFVSVHKRSDGESFALLSSIKLETR